MPQASQYATFFVDGLFFGIDVLRVQEVLRTQEMTPVPLAPAVIEGLINLRGQIVTALDLRKRLGLPPRIQGAEAMSVVVRTADGPVSLLVDDIGDVLEPDASVFDSAPDNMDARARELVNGVYRLDERLLLVLDTEKAVDVAAQTGPQIVV